MRKGANHCSRRREIGSGEKGGEGSTSVGEEHNYQTLRGPPGPSVKKTAELRKKVEKEREF